MSTTPYMNLLLPDPTITPGPLYATENNSAFGVIDAHDHTTGKGVKVPTAGININGDLDFGDFNATGFRSLRLTANISPLGTVSDLGCVYRSGIDLWYNDGNGVQIQLTAGGGLNAASIGAIGGDYTTSTASVFYTSASKTFSFTQDTNKAAAMDFGPFTFRRESLSAPGITFQPDVTLVSDYTMTWPGALPASTKLLQSSNTGALSFTDAPSLASLSVSGAVSAGSLSVSGNSTFTGDATVNGNTTLGNASGDTLTINATPTAGSANSMRQATTRSVGSTVGVGGVGINGSGAYSGAAAYAPVVITTSGRPVQLVVQGDSGSNASVLDGDPSFGCVVYFRRNGTRICKYQLDLGGATFFQIPANLVHVDNNGGAGTYTYDVEFGATIGFVNTFNLIAYEL